MTIATLAGVTYGPRPRTADPAYASSLAQPPRLIVIHDTSNDATKEQEAKYAATRTDSSTRWTSAHFYVDDGGVLGSVPLSLRAWAAYSYANRYGIHIEMCGYNAGAAGAVTASTIAITARLVAQLAALFNIPLVKLTPAQVAAGARGICGHYDVTIGLGVGDHDDPGPKFDWAAFMRLVKGEDEMLDLNQPVPIDANADGSDKNVPLRLWMRTVGIRTNYIGNVILQEMKSSLGEVKTLLQAAADPDNTSVQLSEEQAAKLEAGVAARLEAAIAALDVPTPTEIADAVVDEEHARLAS